MAAAGDTAFQADPVDLKSPIEQQIVEPIHRLTFLTARPWATESGDYSRVFVQNGVAICKAGIRVHRFLYGDGDGGLVRNGRLVVSQLRRCNASLVCNDAHPICGHGGRKCKDNLFTGGHSEALV